MNKKKRSYLFAGLGTILILAIVALRLTNGLQFYKIPTPSSEFTIARNSLIFGSRWVEPRRFDFIAYSMNSDQLNAITKSSLYSGGQTLLTHRLCGMPGDKILIRNGVLYVNGRTTDSSFHLCRPYKVPTAKAQDLQERFSIPEDEMSELTGDSAIVFLDQRKASAEGLTAFMYKAIGDSGQGLAPIFPRDWNEDQFGPVVVPAGSYFLLGDNRENSLDSRYLGFIPQSAWSTTILGKH